MDKKVKKLITVLVTSQELINQLDELEGFSKVFKPNVKHHTSRLIIALEKSLDRILAMQDSDEYTKAIMDIIDVNIFLMKEISELDTMQKRDLLVNFDEIKKRLIQ